MCNQNRIIHQWPILVNSQYSFFPYVSSNSFHLSPDPTNGVDCGDLDRSMRDGERWSGVNPTGSLLMWFVALSPLSVYTVQWFIVR